MGTIPPALVLFLCLALPIIGLLLLLVQLAPLRHQTLLAPLRN